MYPNQKELQSEFEYIDGRLKWRNPGYSRNEFAGHFNKSDGYMYLKWKGKLFKFHRLVWICHFGEIPPELQIDHINRVKTDNRIENLRLVTRSQNQLNKTSNNPYGRGVTYEPSNKGLQKWRARIKLNSRLQHIGYYDTVEEAQVAFKEVELLIRGKNGEE